MEDPNEDDFTDLQQYPIHTLLEEIVNKYLVQLKSQESKILGKQQAIRALEEHYTNGTVPNSFPKPMTLRVTEKYMDDANKLVQEQFNIAFQNILKGTIEIRGKELVDE